MAGEVTKAKLDAIEDGLQAALDKIQALLDAEAYAETLPIIGTRLQNTNVAETVTRVRDQLKYAVDQVSNLSNLASLTPSQVASELTSRINQALNALQPFGFNGVSLAAADNLGNVSITVDTGRTFNLPFDLTDLGMSGLGLNLAGQGNAALTYDFDFKVGVDTTGFYLDTSVSKLNVTAGLSLGNLATTGQLGLLNFGIANKPDSDPAAGFDSAKLDLVTSWNTTGLVRNFTGDILNVTMSGDVDLDIALNANMGSAALPKISADMHVDWTFSQRLLNGSGANSWGDATLLFDNVKYDFGTFVETYITPILDRLDAILGPINTALAVFRTDISGVLLPEWAEMLDIVDDNKVTLLDFLQLAANRSGQSVDLSPISKILDVVDKITDAVEFFRGKEFADAGYNIGNYQTILTQIQGATDTLKSLPVGSGTFTSSAVGIAGFLTSLATGGAQGFSDSYKGKTASDMVASLIGDTILDFPFVEQPISIIRLLLGQDIDLFTLTFPTVNLALGMNAAGQVTTPIPILPLPIWPFPVISAQVGVAAQALINLKIGYDTSGLRSYATGGFANTNLILNGLFLDDQRSGTTDIPEIVIRAAIDMVIDANFLGASIGGGGNLIGEVELDFANSLFGTDGRLYLNELPAIWSTNKLAIFDVEGRITAGLRAYVNAPWGNVWRWNSDRVTLASFSAAQGAVADGPPPGLGDKIGSELWINIGTRALERDITNKTDGSELIEIDAIANGGVQLTGFGRAQSFDGPLSSIQADGNSGNDQLLLDATVNVAVRASGGAGSDVLQGGSAADRLYGGTQDDWLLGRAGADELYGEDGNDYLEGGADADRIDGGAGDYDTASYTNAAAGVTVNLTTGVHTGDAAGDTFFGIEAIEGSRHADTLTGDGNANILSGIDGNDTIRGEGGDDVLAGGRGTNSLDGGSGYDIVNYRSLSTGITATISGLGGTVTSGPAGALVVSDTLSDIEQVDGTDVADTMIGGAGTQIFVGNGGVDILDGGEGDDLLIGGVGGDTLRGGTGFDTASYIFASSGVTANLATGGTIGEAQGDSFEGIEALRGSSGNDTLTGDDLANTLWGAEGNDTLFGQGGDDILEGGAGADSHGGGDGYDFASYAGAAAAITLDRLAGTGAGDAAGDSFAGIEGYIGSRFDDVIRGSNSVSPVGGIDLNLIADNQNNAGTGVGDGDFNVKGAWTAANPVEFDIMVGSLQGLTTAALQLTAVDVDPLDGGTAAEIDEILVNGVAIGFLTIGGNTNDAVSFTAIGLPSWLLVEGANRITIRNVNAVGAGTYQFGITAARLIVNVPVVEEIRGGDGNDTLYGGAGFDRLLGEAGDDQLFGEADADVLRGGAGNDGLSGGAGDDQLFGDAGADVLSGGEGNDLLSGGTGSDTIDGGAGRDRVSYADAASGVSVNLSTTERTLNGLAVGGLRAFDGSGGIDSFVAADGLSTVEDARGSAFDDHIAASEGGSILEGLGGNDVLVGLLGADVLIGGAGNDTLSGGGGTQDVASYETDVGTGVTVSLATNLATDGWGNTDTLSGIEWLRGSAGNDTLTGDGGVNRIEGGAGNDLIDGGVGGDTMIGGEGDDIYVVDANGGANDDVVTENTGYGTDLIRTSVDYTTALASGVEDLQLLGSVVRGTGNSDANRMIGNDAGNIMDGREGADTFWGYGGDDVYTIDSLGDTIGAVTAPRSALGGAGEVAGGGVDEIRLKTAAIYNGTAQSPTVHTYSLLRADLTQVENLVLLDNDRRVNLIGNALDNRLVGNDHVTSIVGGEGNDTMVVGIGDADTDGGTGNDTLVVDWSRSQYAVDMAVPHAANAALGGWNGDYRVGSLNWYASFVSVENFHITSGSANDSFRTADGNDIVTLNAGDDFVNVFAGNDRGDGGTGTDGISANYATETLAIRWNLLTNSYSEGEDGTANDKRAFTNFEYFGELSTGSGNDVITTITGYRSEVIRTGAGDDRVTFREGDDDFFGGAGFDTLVVDWSHSQYRVDMAVSHVANATLGGWNGDFRVGSLNWYASFDSAERFEITTGSAGDTIRTADNDDIVRLNAGNDFVDVFAGFDQADGGADHDGISANYGTDTLAIRWNLQTNSYSEGEDGTANDKRVFNNFEYFGTLTTGSGNDVIVTTHNYNHETINTGAGDDRVTFVNGGPDVFNAGTGNDTLVIDWSWSQYAADTSNTPTGTAAAGYGGSYRVGSLNQFMDYTGVERFEITTGSAGDSIRTGDNNDIVRLGAGDDFTNVGKGFDEADGGTGADGISADYSGDTTAIVWNLATNSYSEGSDGLAGDKRAFTNFEYFGELLTGSGNDVVTTTTGYRNEVIRTGAGDDRVTFREGDDDFFGGEGFDTLAIDWSHSQYSVTMRIPHAANATIGGWNGDYVVGSLNWYASFDSAERFEITTGSGGDNIRTADNDDIVKLNAGSDFVDVFAGNDRADGGADHDGISANYGTDTLAIRWDLQANTYSEGEDGTANDKRVFSNFEYFGTLTTGSGNDVIVTTHNYNHETVNTGAGDDRVTFVNGGADVFNAGTGNDTLVIDWSWIDYAANVRAGPTANEALGGFDGGYLVGSLNQYMNYSSVERFEITTGMAGDSITTATGNDIVRLNAGNDFVDIGTGNDQADGGANHDGISAHYGTDTLAILWDLQKNTYSEGSDGTANDKRAFSNFEYFGTLTTGSGNDVIVTTHNYNHETINTGAGDDRVTFVNGGADVFNAGTGNDTLVIDWNWIDYAADVDIGFTGTAAAGYAGGLRVGSLNQYMRFADTERFEITTGSAGDNIRTGDNADIVKLGAGNDFANVLAGNDQADGGSGHDGISANYADETLAIRWNLQANTYSEGDDGTANDKRAFTNFEFFGTLTTGSGNDVIVTTHNYNHETINTGAGDDRVTFVNGGADTMNGGAGLDTLVIDWAWSQYGADVDIALTGTLEDGFIGGYRIGSWNQYMRFSAVERFEINATQARDVLTTAGGNDILTMNGGDDHAMAGGGDDQLFGGDGSDTLEGQDGDDLLVGGTGGDVLRGGAGNDTISYAADVGGVIVNLTVGQGFGNAAQGDTFTGIEHVIGSAYADFVIADHGDNRIDGGDGDDILMGALGADLLIGGAGNDMITYEENAGAVFVNLFTGMGFNNAAQGDRFEGIENVRGTIYNDYLIGSEGINRLEGGNGDDTLLGGIGGDHLVGGAGSDTASYEDNYGSVFVNMATGRGFGNAAQGDTYDGIENVHGSIFNDYIIGDAAANRLDGGAGDDILIGGTGADELVGGAGSDTASYEDNAGGVFVNLASGMGYGNSAQGDRYFSIENITGSVFADFVIGDDFANVIDGGAGDDTFIGGLGADTLIGGAGTDTVSYEDNQGAVKVNLETGHGTGAAAEGDRYSGIENVLGSSSGDTLIGDAAANRLDGGGGDDVLIGGLGGDALIGGAGNDTVSYADNFGGVFVNLSTGAGSSNAAQGDTYSSIEHVIGSNADDFIIGDAGANRLDGGLGADTLIGAGGADVFVFSQMPDAADTIGDFAAGVDKIELVASAFAGLAAGAVSAAAFASGTSATTAAHRIVYDAASGKLWFDADGSGSGAAVLVATFNGQPPLTAADFLVA